MMKVESKGWGEEIVVIGKMGYRGRWSAEGNL